MSTDQFVDYYELLQLSYKADAETIERIFRHLAQKFHPDHNEAADQEYFIQIVEAHKVLADPESRAVFDVKYQDYWNSKWGLTSVARDMSAVVDDKATRERMLSLLYAQRRSNMNNPGLGEYELSHLLRTPLESVEFHLWYIKSKGWVERLGTGHLAITALGVDQVEQSRSQVTADRLIEAPGPANVDEATRQHPDRDSHGSDE